MNGLEGKRVVVTGGTSGIGEATSRRFLAEGARVVALAVGERASGVRWAYSAEMTAVAVRSARLEDADQLAGLFDQLGHPQTGDALRGALENVLADPRADVLVADDGGALVGAATYFFVPVVHDSRPRCRITTLVVDEAHRGHGVGRMLVAAAEAAAREAACARIEATSALHRTGAHRFYERLGYGRTSEHFLKRL